jgi:3-dehydroquinate dehydratase-1
MSMGRLGLASRAAGFLFGSDLSFAGGRQSSAPGQIPIAELRAIVDGLARHA